MYQDRFLKPENTPLEQSKEKVNPGIALQRRHFVFLQYFLTLTNKYTITRLQGGPGPESSQLSCMVHPQLPVLLTALTLLHLQTLVTPAAVGEDPFGSEGGDMEPSLYASGDAHLSLSWRFLSGQ